MIKTFRGLLADDGQDRIRLSTMRGKVGYRIGKLELIYYDPTGDTAETVVCIWKTEQSTLTDKIDFTDSDLLAGSFMEANSTDGYYPIEQIIIFDREVFNQDIYITNKPGQSASNGVNYYLELEVMPLDDTIAEYTTIKDLRTRGF